MSPRSRICPRLSLHRVELFDIPCRRAVRLQRSTRLGSSRVFPSACLESDGATNHEVNHQFHRRFLQFRRDLRYVALPASHHSQLLPSYGRSAAGFIVPTFRLIRVGSAVFTGVGPPQWMQDEPIPPVIDATIRPSRGAWCPPRRSIGRYGDVSRRIRYTGCWVFSTVKTAGPRSGAVRPPASRS